MTSAHVDRFVQEHLPPVDAQPDFLLDSIATACPERLNAGALLLARGAPDAPAVVNDAGRWTYADMQRMSDAIARLLTEDEGLVPGNRVLLRGVNTAMMFAAWAGILKAGGVVVATMAILRPGEIITILDRAQVSHAIVDSRAMADFTIAAESSATLRSVLTYDGDAGTGALETRMTGAAPGFDAVDTHRDDPALIAFTSGTTGKPKGCIHFHRDIIAPADRFAATILKPSARDVWLTSAPIAFTFGLGMTLIFPWYFGGTAVTLEQSAPAALLDAVRRFGVTTLATAPTAYKTLLGLLDEAPPPSLRTCVSAGEHLSEAVWQAWRAATGIAIVDGLGATEMMHIFVSASGDDIRPGATGKAVPGYDVVVLDEANQPMATGTGRLAVKGPTGCRYLDDPRQANYVVDGWNVTGDTYERDAEGYFRYVARSDDMIVSSGYNISAAEVENALSSHDAVLECAVVGVACPERGMKVKAFVVATAPDDALAQTLKDHVKARIAPYKYPREIEFVDQLPKTATGKTQRFALRARG